MKVYSGSSNIPLAKKIAKELGADFGSVELSQFANGEARVYVQDKSVNTKVIVVQSFSYPPDKHIMEFCLLCDAIRRKGARHIIAVIPWMGYCVQDKVFRRGEPLSSKVIANIIETTKADNIITIDLHNQTIEGFFETPFKELFTTGTIIEYLKNEDLKIDGIISPDVGAFKKASIFARNFELPMVTINKKRDLKTGKTSIIGVDGKIEGKRVLIVDDFISTGGTLMQSADYLKEQGVKKVYAALAHHFYIDGVQEKIEKSKIDRLYVANTINMPKTEDRRRKTENSKLRIIDAAEMIAEAINEI